MTTTNPELRPITEVAQDLAIAPEYLVPYGRTLAKVDRKILEQPRTRPGKGRLVLVSAVTPTPAGEGKTTTSIGLAQGLRRIGESVCLALREPSLGPCMGAKGGGAGGGRSQVEPSDRINLHCTGDFHAVTSAHNFLATLIDNHLHFGNALGIDVRKINWRRALDMNDRSLRNTVVGLGGVGQGIPRETGFDITAASEVMAILALATDTENLRERLSRILVASTRTGDPIHAEQLGGIGAMMALLRDVLDPNLVQTTEGVPALVHCGPFANIAHGCNSVLATRTALHLADWAITEAGFGFDLGGEKFFDIKARAADIDVAAVVMVTTVRALKMHGDVPLKQLTEPNADAVKAGLSNLERHAETVQMFGFRPVIALNRRVEDTEAEIDVIRQFGTQSDLPFAVSSHFMDGGAGAEDLARVVVESALPEGKPGKPVYEIDDPIKEKLHSIATKVYGADGVILAADAEKKIKRLRKLGLTDLPICMAKTQKSLSDDPGLLGRPTGFKITVRDFEINAGAGFLVALTGDMLRMPGLPRVPNSENIDVQDGEIIGLT